MKRDYRDEFRRWKEASLLDDDLVAELNAMEENEAEKEDAFYKDTIRVYIEKMDDTTRKIRIVFPDEDGEDM